MQFSGCVYRDMQFHIEFHADGLQLGIRDLDWTWTKLPWMNVMVGQIKMPNSRERQLSSGAVHFPERAFPSQGIAAVGRETGVQLSGMDILDLFGLQGHGWDGIWIQQRATAVRRYIKFRLCWTIYCSPFRPSTVLGRRRTELWAPLLEASFTYMYAPQAIGLGELNALTTFDLCQAYGLASQGALSPTAGCTRPPQTTPGYTTLPLGRSNINPNAIGDWQDIGFDATFMYRGFYANVESHNLTYKPNNGNPNLARFSGLRTVTYFIDVGYFIIPRELEIMGRYQYLNINSGRIYPGATAANLTSSNPTLNRNVLSMREFDLGCAWYLSRDHRHKIRVAYNWREEFGDLKFHNNGVQLDLQLAF